MTTMASYLSVDGRGVCHAYLMSDSRISWSPDVGNNSYYDKATKLFCVGNGPDVFGYCGNSLFGSLALHSLASYLNYSSSFFNSDDIDHKKTIVEGQLEQIMSAYPREYLVGGVQIVYLTRAGAQYHLHEYSFDRGHGSVS